MYGEWWEKLAHADIFVAHCGFQVQYCDKFKHLVQSLENVLKVVSVLFFARTPSKITINGSNEHTTTVQLLGGVPPHLSGRHVSYVSLANVINRLLPIDAFLRMRARMSLRAVDAFLRQLRSSMLNDGYFPEDYVTLTIFLSTRNHNHQGIYFRSKQYKYP